MAGEVPKRGRRVLALFAGALLLALGAMLILACEAGADEPQDSAKARREADEEYRSVRAQINQLAREESLDGIAALVATSAAKWRPLDPTLAAGLVIQVAGNLHSRVFRNRGRASYIAQEMVLNELRANDKLNVAQRAGLVAELRYRLGSDGRRLTGDEYAQERLEQMRLWVDAWTRIEAAIDPAWDAEGRLDPFPPPPEGYPARVRPRDIQDPEVRKAYVRAIRAKMEEREARLKQADARAARDSLVPKLRLRILLAAKEEPPVPRDELLSVTRPVQDRAGVDELVRELYPDESRAKDGSPVGPEGK